MIELIDKLIDSSRRTLCNNNQGLNDYLDWTSILRRRLNQMNWCKYTAGLWKTTTFGGKISWMDQSPCILATGLGRYEWLAKEKVSRIEKCRMS